MDTEERVRFWIFGITVIIVVGSCLWSLLMAKLHKDAEEGR